MEKIKRPKKIEKFQQKYLSNEKFQDYTNKQLESIYEKLDEIVEKLNN